MEIEREGERESKVSLYSLQLARAHRYLQKILENRDLVRSPRFGKYLIRKWGAAPSKKPLLYRETVSMGPS